MPVCTYNDYTKEPSPLTFDQMVSIHEKMKEEIGDDPDVLDLYQDLLKTALEYSSIRAQWNSMSREERMEKDSSRTAKHDSLIARLNALARYLEGTGHDAEWRDEITKEEVGYGRKRIGDFGCFLAFVEAVNAR